MPSPSPQKPVVVRFEKSGRGGKVVTIVAGLNMHPDGKSDLLSVLKKKLGTGGAVKDGLLELQGDQRDRLFSILINQGYNVTRGN